MSLQQDIYARVKRLEPWMQELYLRAAASPEIAERDIEEVIAVLLEKELHTPAPREVSPEDLPGADGDVQPLTVCSISEICSVNLLADGQTLAFASTGLNLVYGQNGSGKTGYSRIFKHSGRTLRSETVLANVSARGCPPPSATVTIAIGGSEQDIPVDLQAPPPALLGRICVADALSAEEYLVGETEVDYTPRALQGLTRLANALGRVSKELAARIADAQPASPLDLRPYGEATAVAGILAQLSASTETTNLKQLATLSELERERLDELTRKHGEIQAQQAPVLRKAAEDAAQRTVVLATEIRGIYRALGPVATRAASERLAELQGAREASALAAEGFTGEPHPGAGSEAWRALWQAARAFVEHEEGEFPPTYDPAYCPLCMQPLSAQARARLERFDVFVNAEIALRVTRAEQAIETANAALPDVPSVLARNRVALEALEAESCERVERWLDDARAATTLLRKRGVETPHALSEPPVGPLDSYALARTREAAEHAALIDEAGKKSVESELAELRAREELARRLPEVFAHLDALREVQRFERAKAKTVTTRVSNAITELSRQLIECDLQGALNRQLTALGFAALEVVVRPRTVRGRPLVSLRFKTVEGVPLNSVLSQGEQRRLSLAMFLAEMEILSDASTVVLDDPVCSIDQDGRRHIAEQLCRLAVDRQVIVFTHELSFVRELQRRAPSLPCHFQHLVRSAGTVGHVREGLPWEGLKATQRVEGLHAKLKRAQSFHGENPERYREDVAWFCSMLRSSYERAVEELLLADTVTRRSDAVHTQELRKVVLTRELCEMVDDGVGACSAWVHDQPLADGAEPPAPVRLRAMLADYEQLLAKVKELRSAGPAKLKALDSSEPLRADHGRAA
ncbi:MAG: AAA family ATPase [Solirubrobacteraceae bacterium]